MPHIFVLFLKYTEFCSFNPQLQLPLDLKQNILLRIKEEKRDAQDPNI